MSPAGAGDSLGVSKVDPKCAKAVASDGKNVGTSWAKKNRQTPPKFTSKHGIDQCQELFTAFLLGDNLIIDDGKIYIWYHLVLNPAVVQV